MARSLLPLVLLAMAPLVLPASVARASPQTPGESSPEAPAEAPGRRYEATGVVRALAQDRSYVVIAHDEIPGLMRAMTMPFDVRSPALLDGLARGDSVRFTLTVTDGGRHVIERIERR